MKIGFVVNDIATEQAGYTTIRLAMAGDWKGAAAANSAIVEAFPEDVEAINRLGKALTELGQTKKAVEAYERALVDLREVVTEEEGPDIRESMMEERRTWFTNQLSAGVFPEDLKEFYKTKVRANRYCRPLLLLRAFQPLLPPVSVALDKRLHRGSSSCASTCSLLWRQIGQPP